MKDFKFLAMDADGKSYGYMIPPTWDFECKEYHCQNCEWEDVFDFPEWLLPGQLWTVHRDGRDFEGRQWIKIFDVNEVK